MSAEYEIPTKWTEIAEKCSPNDSGYQNCDPVSWK